MKKLHHKTCEGGFSKYYAYLIMAPENDNKDITSANAGIKEKTNHLWRMASRFLPTTRAMFPMNILQSTGVKWRTERSTLYMRWPVGIGEQETTIRKISPPSS